MDTRHPNRREFSRSPSSKKVEVLVEGRAPLLGHADNISLNGIAVVCSETLEAGTQCEVRIHLDSENGGPVIVVNAHVARCTPGLLAVEIDSVDPDSFVHLRMHVHLNSENPDLAEDEFLAHHGLRAKHPEDEPLD